MPKVKPFQTGVDDRSEHIQWYYCCISKLGFAYDMTNLYVYQDDKVYSRSMAWFAEKIKTKGFKFQWLKVHHWLALVSRSELVSC
jgi:hypothetical protein